VPMVNSAGEARAAVEALRYPPKGRRGVGLARAQGYGTRFEEYREWVERESLVIVQIEHIKGVENIEDIMSVEGVDGFFVGPYDLSGSLGVPGQFDHPGMIEAMNRILAFIESTPKIAGYHVVEPDVEQFRKRVDEGYRFLAYSVDIRLLDTGCRSAIKKIRR
jgi:2-keto-3-deoxy-L-rhamnonate aldolase RhmA